jgi:hypothetical protein
MNAGFLLFWSLYSDGRTASLTRELEDVATCKEFLQIRTKIHSWKKPRGAPDGCFLRVSQTSFRHAMIKPWQDGSKGAVRKGTPMREKAELMLPCAPGRDI